MKYLPFNLETALKHPEKVRTRDGRKIDKLVHFEGLDESLDSAVIAQIDGRLITLYASGKFINYEHRNDLFLINEVKECWVNVYDNGKIFPKIGECRFSSKDEAINCIDQLIGKYIKTIRITNEPE
jgi:hypothetical protein